MNLAPRTTHRRASAQAKPSLRRVQGLERVQSLEVGRAAARQEPQSFLSQMKPGHDPGSRERFQDKAKQRIWS